MKKALFAIIILLLAALAYVNIWQKPTRNVQSVRITPTPTLPPTNDPVEKIMRMSPEERHKEMHYIEINDEPTQAVPYLRVPFRKADVLKNTKAYFISEGLIYSEDEREIHSMRVHGGVDFTAPYGTNVYSPVDGYALASYESYFREDTDGNQITYKGNPITIGFGYFVLIYAPDVDRFVILSHFADIDESIPFIPPRRDPDSEVEGWVTTVKRLSSEEVKEDIRFIKIKRGDLLGTVGYSGLPIDHEDYEEGADRPVVIDPQEHKSWDEPHIHMEEFWVDPETRVKGWNRDPYALYDTYEEYPSLLGGGKLGKDHLLLLDRNGLPQFAKE